MISIEVFDLNLLKIDKKLYKNIDDYENIPFVSDDWRSRWTY